MAGDTNAANVEAKGFVDIYVLPVPENNLEAYREQATLFGQVAKENGALSYREFRGTELGSLARAGEGEVLTTAVAEFNSEAHRDAVMGRVMEDPRVKAMLDADPLTDMKKMNCGGFETFVTA